MEKRRYSGPFHNGIVVAAATVFAVIGLSSFSAPSDELPPGLRTFFLVMSALATMVAVRSLRAGVVPQDTQLLVRGFFRTRRLRWSDIQSFGTTGANAMSLISWNSLVVHLRVGKDLKVAEVSGVARSRRHDVAESAAGALNRHLADRKPGLVDGP